MNRKLISDAISDIDDSFIEEAMSSPVVRIDHAPERTSNMGKSENTRNVMNSRRWISVILAACLVFTLAITAYASNLFGIREMFRIYNPELPGTVDPYIQHHTENTAGDGWSARIAESLCDTGKILTTVTISGGDKYIVVNADAKADDPISMIGMEGDQTLSEYAEERGKELLFVGATLAQNEHLGIFMEAQTFVNLSDSEMNILVESSRSGEESGDAICRIYARDESGNLLNLEVPFTLKQAPAGNERVYVPVNPDAIPGMKMGEATVKETPLGLSVCWLVTITDREVANNVMLVKVEGVTYREGGFVVEDDGSRYFQFAMGEGDVGDTMIAHFYDWDHQWIGDVVFEKK